MVVSQRCVGRGAAKKIIPLVSTWWDGCKIGALLKSEKDSDYNRALGSQDGMLRRAGPGADQFAAH